MRLAVGSRDTSWRMPAGAPDGHPGGLRSRMAGRVSRQQGGASGPDVLVRAAQRESSDSSGSRGVRHAEALGSGLYSLGAGP
jgi:hypothetical protein